MKIILTILYFVLSSNKDNWGSIQASVMCVSSCLILTKLTSKWQLSELCILLLKMSNYPASQGCFLDDQFWERSTFRYGNWKVNSRKNGNYFVDVVYGSLWRQASRWTTPNGNYFVDVVYGSLWCQASRWTTPTSRLDYHYLVLTT